MGKVKVSAFSISLDGYGAAPEQSQKEPFGKGGMVLADWMRNTRHFHKMFGGSGGSAGVDDKIASDSMQGFGAWIMGRNMFSPFRGPLEDSWKGWWGEEPLYHAPVFVLTHHGRKPMEMKGGTTFHFITEGPEAALKQARAAAGGKDVRVGGGVATVRQFLEKRLLDQIHLAVAPVVLGKGENLFSGLDLAALGYKVVSTTPGEGATHVYIERA